MAQVLALSPIFERRPASIRRYKELVVFIHQYGGHKHSFIRHMDWINDLGFDVITFDLPLRQVSDMIGQNPLNKEWKFGLRHLWADKIEEVLGSLLEEKFLFSFSYSSVAALMALERRHGIDVRGWICEGGPFINMDQGIDNLIASGELEEFNWKALQYPILRRPWVKILSLALGKHNYERDTLAALKSLPKGFPVLSIRSEKDALISPHMIDQFFAPAFNRIDFHRITLQRSPHLGGLKEETDLYKQTVSHFLEKNATQIINSTDGPRLTPHKLGSS